MCKNHQLEGLSIEFYEKPKKLVFLLHGYGDNSHNFITLANYLVDSELSINFYIPDAPLSVPQYPSGRQWFDLYPNGIYFNEAGEKEKKILEQDCLSSLKLIKVYIDNLCNKFNLNYSDCFILGFSQGSMVTFEFGKYIDQVFAGCILLSGTIVALKHHKNKYFRKTPILILHGDKDIVIEPKYFHDSCNILKNEGFVFESSLLEGLEHSVSEEMLTLTKNFIKKHMT